MTGKCIIIGNVREEFYDSPIKMFKMAVRLSKQENWTVKSNNPQFIEALEVLCGEDNVEVYFKKYTSKSMQLITFKDAYDYLGDIYDIVNMIRFVENISDELPSDDKIITEIKRYERKWEYLE